MTCAATETGSKPVPPIHSLVGWANRPTGNAADAAAVGRLAHPAVYNPVKHGLARNAADWPWSTFGRFVIAGEYEQDWGEAEPDHLVGWTDIRE